MEFALPSGKILNGTVIAQNEDTYTLLSQGIEYVVPKAKPDAVTALRPGEVDLLIEDDTVILQDLVPEDADPDWQGRWT